MKDLIEFFGYAYRGLKKRAPILLMPMVGIINIITNIIGMAKININGEDHEGQNITIKNNRVIIDGTDVTPDSKIITVNVDGDVDKIQAGSADVEVTGNVGNLTTGSGDVNIEGDVNGNLTTSSGNVEITGNVTGSVKTMSGDVDCYDIGGTVTTGSGNVSR